MKASSPKMKKLLNRRNNALYSPQIYTTKELLDKTNNKTIYKYHSIYNKQALNKKAPSSPKTKKNARGLTINPNLKSQKKKVKCVTPNPRKNINLEITRDNFRLGKYYDYMKQGKSEKDQKRSPALKERVFEKQSLSCKNKFTNGKALNLFFKSNKAKKPKTPVIRKRNQSKNGYNYINSKAQNYFTSKRKESQTKNKENKLIGTKIEKTKPTEEKKKARKTIDLLNIMNIHSLSQINIDFFLSHFAKILALFYYFDNKDDCYLVIKQYTEEVQQESFLVLESLFKGKKKGEEVLTAFKLEIITIMLLFYFFVENENIGEKEINTVLEPLAHNSFAFLGIIKKGFNFILKRKKVKKISTFLKESETDKLFTASKNPFKKIKKNNEIIIEALDNIVNLVNGDVQTALKDLISKVKTQTLSDAIYNSFEFFHSILKQKGVIVAMETPDAPLLSEDNPNFIIQPFDYQYNLPKKTSKHPITLVLDLDETLIHYDESINGGQFFIRPHSQEFLKETAKMFEIVIFTAAVKDYADWILDRLDPEGNISHRLYRCSTSETNGVYIKDLQKLGREMSKMLIIDNSPENFQLQPENGIYIKSWYDDPDDTALVELLKILQFVAKTPQGDVRDVLKNIRNNPTVNN